MLNVRACVGKEWGCVGKEEDGRGQGERLAFGLRGGWQGRGNGKKGAACMTKRSDEQCFLPKRDDDTCPLEWSGVGVVESAGARGRLRLRKPVSRLTCIRGGLWRRGLRE